MFGEREKHGSEDLEEEEPVNDEVQGREETFKKPCHRRIPTASGSTHRRLSMNGSENFMEMTQTKPTGKVPMIIETLEKHQFEVWKEYQRQLELEPSQ